MIAYLMPRIQNLLENIRMFLHIVADTKKGCLRLELF